MGERRLNSKQYLDWIKVNIKVEGTTTVKENKAVHSSIFPTQQAGRICRENWREEKLELGESKRKCKGDIQFHCAIH